MPYKRLYRLLKRKFCQFAKWLGHSVCHFLAHRNNTRNKNEYMFEET
jgi:hypothetical protein